MTRFRFESVEDWVQQELGGYVRLSVSERKEAVAELAGDGMSQRAIGEVLGVDHVTVHNDLRSGENSPVSKAGSKKNNNIAAESGENSPPLDTISALAATEEVQAAAARVAKREVSRQAGRQGYLRADTG